MKIDRLLSIIIHLLNHELTTASALAERFGVTVRTIQRDMETIQAAGIPIYAVPGPHGGYAVVESYRMDRQLMSVQDFYYIVTALSSVASSLSDERIDGTLEKVRALLPERPLDLFAERDAKLSIDFSMLGGDQRYSGTFRTVKEAVEAERLVRFSYTNNKLETTTRTVEPMTIAFRWRSWYLYGWCTTKRDYRLFRISRIRDPEILAQRFRRREQSFESFIGDGNYNSQGNSLRFVLEFAPEMRSMVEEYYPPESCRELPDGGLRVETRMPEDGWLYGYILSFGQFVRVIEPPHLREIIADAARSIAKMYDFSG